MRKKEIKKKLYSTLEQKDYTPKTRHELEKELKLSEKSDKRRLRQILRRGVDYNDVLVNEEHRYLLPPKIEGQFLANNRGFGFVRTDGDIFENDIYISPHNLNGAYDKDRVLIEVYKNPTESHRAEGRVIEILDRGNQNVVGRFNQNENSAFVFVDNDKLNRAVFIDSKNYNNAQSGDKVVVEITDWPTESMNPIGKIVDVLGNPDEPGVDIMSIIKSYNVPVEFPEEVIEEAQSFDDVIKEEELNRRLDLRDQTIFTIDGPDSKDFDDAVSIEKLDNGNYKLGVHIADVSHYVEAESPLDLEAEERGTSIYALNKVVPMLPEELSNDLCSLVPEKDRLTLSCIMEVNPKGEVVDYDIKESVIHSNCRMTYPTVNAFLDDQINDETSYLVPFKEDLKTMEELAKILREERRGKRGSIDFEFEEAHIVVDEEGKPVEVEPRERGTSERLIEEFMLLANETVAKHVSESPLTFIYRNHPNPDQEALQNFRKFIGKLGFKLGKAGELPTNKDYQKLLEEIKGTPYENIITLLSLRTMQQAVYQAENKGHFALGAEDYTHFTSPIRRYPDLTVHRNIKLLESGEKLSDLDKIELQHKIEKQAKHSSEAERTAVEIEREVDKLKKAEYMKQHEQERFTGRISGVTGFGLFVELPNTVEGLIGMSELLDDYYIFDEENHRLVGERFGNTYNLGDEIDIVVDHVDVKAKRIDFAPAVPTNKSV